MCTLIGIDWSKNKHNICIVNEAGARIFRFSIPHSTSGFLDLEAKVNKLGVPLTDCLIGLETAHNLLIDFLWSRGFCLYVIPPSVVSSNRDRHRSSRAHNDDSDAFLIADLLRTDRHRFAPWKPDGQLVRRMKAKLSLIDSLTKTITAYSNRLQAVLLRYYPQALALFSQVKTQICLRFLIAYPTPQAALSLTYSDFAGFCRSQGYTQPHLLPDSYAQLRQPTPEPDPVVTLAHKGETVFLAKLLLEMVRQKAREIREVQKLFTRHPDQAIFDSLPGAGDLLAPKLLVMLGDHRERYPTPQTIRALACTPSRAARRGVCPSAVAATAMIVRQRNSLPKPRCGRPSGLRLTLAAAWPGVTPRATPTAAWLTVGWASSGSCGKVENSMMRPITCSKSSDIAVGKDGR